MTKKGFSIDDITLASIIISTLFIFSYATYKELTGKEYRDDYILGVNIAIVSYQLLLLLLVFISTNFNVPEGILNFIQPMIIFGITLFAFRFFKLGLNWDAKPQKVIYAVLVGIIFGASFFYVGESAPVLFDNGILVLLVFTFFVAIAEELLFRNIIFSLAEKAFTKTTALYTQAMVFSLIHFSSSVLDMQWWRLLIYLGLLFLFAVVAGLFIEQDEQKNMNLTYAIIIHLVANLINIFFSLF